MELRISCTATDYDFAQSLVRAGIGIALIPRIGLTGHPDLLSLPLAEPAPHRHLGLVLSRRRRGHRARLAEELAARLTAESATLAYTRTDGPASPQAAPAR